MTLCYGSYVGAETLSLRRFHTSRTLPNQNSYFAGLFLLLLLALIHLCDSTDFNSYGPVQMAKTTAHRQNGRMAAPIAPGLGVEPDMQVLGKPVFVIQ